MKRTDALLAENEELRRRNALLIDHLRKYLHVSTHLYSTTIDEGAEWARKTREILEEVSK